jgi:hypothetical protein
MKWKNRVGIAAVMAVALLRMLFATPAVPVARADFGTPTPTATPADAHCNDVQCG